METFKLQEIEKQVESHYSWSLYSVNSPHALDEGCQTPASGEMQGPVPVRL